MKAVIGPVGRRMGKGHAEKSEWNAPATPCSMRYSVMPTIPSVSRYATSPNATVDVTVAQNMKSAAESVFHDMPFVTSDSKWGSRPL
eukprot:scaffold272012_cov66-Attheya_sp.AAC.1